MEAKCQNIKKRKKEERYSQAIKSKDDKYLSYTAMHLVLYQGCRTQKLFKFHNRLRNRYYHFTNKENEVQRVIIKYHRYMTSK